MKNKNLSKFTKRATHKRRAKEAARKELLRAVRETGVGYDSLKLRDALDSGRRGRASLSLHSDELIARGVYTSSKNGYGFVSASEAGKDIFVPAGKSNGAVDGDLVEAAYTEYTNRYGEEKTDGRVLKIVEYGRKTVIGTVEENIQRYRRRVRRSYILVPDEPRINLRPEILELCGALPGEKAECELLRNRGSSPSCRVVRIFGDSESKNANYEAILADAGIITDFSEDELEQARQVAKEEISDFGRVRKTKEIIFTIDGEDAKDLDDAVSIRRLPGGGFRLGVYIADVSHYVRERTPLDRAVTARGTSVYFTDKVVPMLPTELSNGACSLNAGEEKYALGASIDIDSEGNIKKLLLEECVIVSRVRGVYSEVNSVLSGKADRGLRGKYSEVKDSLNKMLELYHILEKKSRARGAIDFDAPEARIILGDRGEILDIIKRERGVAERMIEQFMLAANEAVATYLTERGIPCVYRIHEAPPPDKLDEFVTYAHNLGFDTSVITKNAPTAKDFSRLLLLAEERGILAPVSYTMLRTMSKAKYSEKQTPHFGLGIENYCHFTSPIRRLSDLATHRIIKRVLFEKKRAEMYAGYARRAAAAATDGELRAISAERRIENLYKTLYMSEFVGDSFLCEVGSVTSFGLFVVLENTCEGLIPISELPGVFTFDEKNLIIRSSNKIYRIADRLTVRLEEADIIRGKLRFSIIEEARQQ